MTTMIGGKQFNGFIHQMLSPLGGTSDTISGAQSEGSEGTQAQRRSLRPIQSRVRYAIYALALAVSISLWFIAIRAPLWLDETHSFYVIKGGFFQIKSRMGWPIVPIYPYILWLGTRVMGTGEIALRIPSILAMLGAMYLLYRAARELFDRDVAVIAAIIFCLHPIVIFASIDVRPYAFAALTINAAILALVQLRHDNSNWRAALFGLFAAGIGHFQFIFTCILPVLAIYFVAMKIDDRKVLWRQGSVALAAFALAFLPVIPVLRVMFNSKGTHVFDEAPKLAALTWTLAPGWLAYIFLGGVFVAAATRRLDVQSRLEGWRILLCTALGLVPVLILYGVSVETPIHVFVERYRLVAIPGIALCWAWLISRIDSRVLRLLFCVALVGTTAYQYFHSPLYKLHGYTWKYALEFTEQNASTDNAPVLICSDFPESDVVSMPAGAAVKDNGLFAPLAYYKLSVPVVGLPRALNDEAIRVVSSFLQEPATRRERFLALGFGPSYKTLQFIVDSASGTHEVRTLGIFDGIAVLEFTPRVQSAGS
ncbi:MAG: glycosyltransferase family 39 protein [Terriglobales bacterium]